MSAILDSQQLDSWEEQLIAYLFLIGDQELEEKCAQDLSDKISLAKTQLKMLPEIWARELCQQTLA